MIAIEVKKRTVSGDALGAVSHRQQQRIARSLAFFATRLKHQGDLRFDVMAVDRFGVIIHIRNAWYSTD